MKVHPGDSSVMRQALANTFVIKTISLWTVFLLGFLFHTQLALMPLFHGLNIAESHTHESWGLSAVTWFMLIFFCCPLLAMIGCVLYPVAQFRLLHCGMTLVYTVLNLLHLVFDILVAVPGYQLFLMVFLLGVGLLLNVVAYQWMRTFRKVSPSQ